MYYDFDGNPIGLWEWAALMEVRTDEEWPTRWQIGRDQIGDMEVSTVWLGLDHNYFGGPPLIFETMIFGGPLDEECWRYSTAEQAAAGHQRAVELARAEAALYSPSDGQQKSR